MLKEERAAPAWAVFSFCRPVACRANKGGFSLIELMIAVVLTAILLSIAIPAFSSMITQNQLATATNAARGALMAARQSAVSKGRPVSLCAGTPGAGCTGDWSVGHWMVFEDGDHSGDIEADERVSGAFGAGRLRVCAEADLAPNARELVISASGRVRLQSVDLDGSCPDL